MDASLITVSYRGDLDLARELCASVEAHVDPAIEHVLIVPSCDLALFQPLAGGRRRIVRVESVLPAWFWRLPAPRRIELGPLLSLRIREIWLTPRGPVRGWIVQQLVKLSADRATDADVLIFADSDLLFIRPVSATHFIHGERVRLYHRPGETKDSAMHQRWHRAAAKLLGLPPADYFGADYIGNVISWRRDVLQKLKMRIAEVAGRPWESVIAHTPALAEYILYGVFAEYVLGEASGHSFESNDLTHASWHYDMNKRQEVERFVSSLGSHEVAVLIQSTTDMPIEERRRLISEMIQERDATAFA